MEKVSKKIEDEFMAAYEELSDSLFRLCYFKTSKREVALDLVQEGFLKTWQHVVRGGEIRNMKSFIYQVVNNLIIDYYRKKKSFSLDSLAEEKNFDPSGDDHESIEKEAEIEIVRKVILKLEPTYQEVMVLRYVEGLTIKEITEIVGESENVVSVRLHRATEKAKKFFKHG
jgi:RNA polymerase sigma-70 factor (ECF subfamily)